jgi:uncharacterized protein (DUF4415 family)
MGSDLKKVDAHVIQPGEYEEAPELNPEQLRRADMYEGERLVRRGRPKLENPKQAVKLRLSSEVIEHFRSTGPGWQTRINAELERAVRRVSGKSAGKTRDTRRDLAHKKRA